MTFLTEELLKGSDWRALERAVARLMSHCGWSDVTVMGRSGDGGADIVALKESNGHFKKWVVQIKAVTGGNYVGVAGLNEVLRAQSLYAAHTVVLATNGSFTDSVVKRQTALKSVGFEVKLWNGKFLQQLLNAWPDASPLRRSLRPYQQSVLDDSLEIFGSGVGKVQYVVATGLGKTVIASALAEEMWKRGVQRILVLCHAQDLALQLEQAFWTRISKSIPTHVFYDGLPPLLQNGINFGLYQSLHGYLSGFGPGDFDLVIVDEAHHAMAHGFRACIDSLNPRYLLGMTATPWRGDGESIDDIFGPPIAKMSLVDGMAMGFLAQIDYRIYCDNINWTEVPQISKNSLSLRDLNKRLFIPQRDEAVIDEILRVCKEIVSPRIAIFSPSVDHSKRFAQMLSAAGVSCASLSGVDRTNRRKHLLDFSAGQIKAVTAVDVLNEGIDVPEVNLIIFMRATHSRRIFVQQLGRGLRLAPEKEKVIVLDFVADIRRMAEAIYLERETRKLRRTESVQLPIDMVKFNDLRAKHFVEEWISDVSDLADADDSEKLKYPDFL